MKNFLKTPLMLLLVFLTTSPFQAQESLQEVTVNAGDTMWNIANKYLKDPQKWPEIVKVNNLPTADPTIALPGSRIKIPIALIKEEYRTAQLLQFIPEVRFKRKEEGDFKVVTPAMILRYEDALRTMKGAQARVKFPTNEIVQINENSYVVLKPEKIMQEVRLLEGEVRASRAKVIMPGGTVVKPQSNNSEYQARIREDKTEVVFVYKGEVNVTAKGKTVKVKEGFGTQVPKFSAPIEPMPLSSFKDFNPADMKIESPKQSIKQAADKPITFTPPTIAVKDPNSTPGKSKSVVSKNILTNYHLQIAQDNKFQKVILERTEMTAKSFDIKQQAIPDGRYYMRVAFMDALGVQGPYSDPTVIIKDTQPPQLSEIKPANGQSISKQEPNCDVSGIARDAAMVSVNGQIVFLGNDGRFNATAYLKEGSNNIRIVARDGNGNETVVERKITYKKQ